MNLRGWWFACLCLALGASAASAACDPKRKVEPNDPDPELQEIRYAAYLQACNRSDGQLVDGQNALYGDHLVRPGDPARPLRDFYPDEAKRRGISGIVYVGVVVEPDGRVSRTLLIRSSKSKLLDDAAMNFYLTMRFKRRPTLDGVPVRVFMLMPVTFKVQDY